MRGDPVRQLPRITLDVYLSNTIERTYPRGSTSRSSLPPRSTEPTGRNEPERPRARHAVPVRRTDRLTHLVQQRWPVDRSHYRVTLDTAEDLGLIRRLIEEHAAAGLDCAGLIQLLDRHPELAAINAEVTQKEPG